MRNPLVIGNWKMNLTLEQASVLARKLKAELGETRIDTEVVICPPMPWLVPVEATLGRSERIKLGVQDGQPGMFGSDTGSVSLGMLKSHIDYVLVGHSERRLAGLDSQNSINATILDALKRGITPVLCVGEFVHLYDRKRVRGRPTKIEAESNIFAQVRHALKGVKKEQLSRVVIAYEPVWAIGSKEPADPAYVAVMATTLRRAVAKQGTKRIAANTRILYGGSVSAANAAQFSNLEQVDGLLVGRSSLDANEFVAIIKAFSRYGR